jgi:hypothetical protein
LIQAENAFTHTLQLIALSERSISTATEIKCCQTQKMTMAQQNNRKTLTTGKPANKKTQATRSLHTKFERAKSGGVAARSRTTCFSGTCLFLWPCAQGIVALWNSKSSYDAIPLSSEHRLLLDMIRSEIDGMKRLACVSRASSRACATAEAQ